LGYFFSFLFDGKATGHANQFEKNLTRQANFFSSQKEREEINQTSRPSDFRRWGIRRRLGNSRGFFYDKKFLIFSAKKRII
jgi:hypothetical protein